jgi:hypothetical protein
MSRGDGGDRQSYGGPYSGGSYSRGGHPDNRGYQPRFDDRRGREERPGYDRNNSYHSSSRDDKHQSDKSHMMDGGRDHIPREGG